MIPVFANPGKRKKKRKRYHGGGIARACRKHGMKGRWRKTSRRRRKIHGYAKRLAKAIHARHKTHRRKWAFGKRLAGAAYKAYGKLSELVYRGEATPAQKKRLASLAKKEAAYQKARARGHALVARRRAKHAGMYDYSSSGSGGGFSMPAVYNNPRRRHMRRHHRFNPPTAAAGITAGFRPSNLIGVLPIIGGAIVNGIARRWVGSKVPMLSSGIPGIAAGIATAGIVGAAVGYIKPGYGQSAFLGGMVETLSEPFASLASKIPGLSGFEIDSNFTGGTLNDFADPNQVQNAVAAGEDMSQYPFPVHPSQVRAMHAPMTGGGAPMRAHMYHKGGHPMHNHPGMMPQAAAPQIQPVEAGAVAATMADYDISSM